MLILSEELMDAKILVVDDNPQNIQVLSTCLANAGYDIEYTQNGTDAIEWFSQESFDMVLLDIMMPEIDGFEVCSQIKSIKGKENVPVIFITAKTDIESITRGFELGGIDYITKPFNDKELLARVNTHVSLKKAQDKLSDLNNWLEKQVAERTKELVDANKQLTIVKKELETLDTAKNDFLNLISHEIRTPLNGIVGIVDIIKDMNQSSETLEFIHLLEMSVERLESFSLKTIDVSILRAKGTSIVKTNNNLIQLIQSSISKIEQKARAKNIEITLNTKQTPLYILCNQEFILKCFYQIFDNSIKFSDNNSVIIVDCTEEGNNILIEIKDTGEGFNQDILNNKIDMFRSAIQSDLSPGLGLFIVKLVIEAHEGEIQFGNNTSGGAYVRLLLPVI